MTGNPWPAGAATGVGSLPGTDPGEAAKLVLGESGDLPYLPELPARGLGADMIARSCALLIDFPVDYQPHGWTVSASSGRDLGRAHDHLARDLDAITEQGQGITLLKVQVTGPMTLAANLELQNLHKILTDHGAFRHLTESLVEGVRVHLADLASRLPGTQFVLQVDEPGLNQVLAGQVPTPSGYGTVRALPPAMAEPALAELLELVPAGHRVVHSCGAQVPYNLIVGAGSSAISVDASLILDRQLDTLGSFIEGGGSLWLGVVPGVDATISVQSGRDLVRPLWNKLGFAPELLGQAVVVTPACGMAGASQPYVRRAMSVLRDLGASLRDEPE